MKFRMTICGCCVMCMQLWVLPPADRVEVQKERFDR